jgi:hypothetical protein
MKESSRDRRTGHVDSDTVDEDSPVDGRDFGLFDTVVVDPVGAPQ